MKQMKEFILAMAFLFVSVTAVWAAYRLSPETWAMIAGVVFGLLATLPMCGIVVMLVMRGQRHDRDSRPPERPYYPAQRPMILDAEPVGYETFGYPAEQTAYYLPTTRTTYRSAQPMPRLAPQRSFIDRTTATYETGEDYSWEQEPPAWEIPSGPRGPRILGQ